MSRNSKKFGFLIFVILLGAITGTLIGDIIGSNFEVLSFLKEYYKIGIDPFYLDLHVLGITLGINFKINLMSIVGILFGIIVYIKY